MNPSTSSGLKTKKSPSTVRKFDKAHCKPPLRPILRSAQDRAQSFGSPQAPLGVTSKERKNTSASLSVTILQKLSILEDLLKKKDDKPLTFKEGCAYLGYAPSYLYKLTYRKVIPYYKPTGKIIFFSKCELDEWVFKSRNQNSEDSNKNYASSSSSTNPSLCSGHGSELQLTTKDPNQVDMFDTSASSSTNPSFYSGQGSEPRLSVDSKSKNEKDASASSAQEKEIVIEFPLKSRRRKEL